MAEDLGARRSTRERKTVRATLNENSLTLAASQGDDDAAEEYAEQPAPRSRKSKGGKSHAEEEEDEEEEADEAEHAAASKPKRGRAAGKRAAAADGASVAHDAATAGGESKKPSRKANTAADAKIDASELTNPVYQQLANSSSTPTALAQDMMKSYMDVRKQEKASLALINFLLQSSGCLRTVSSSDLERDPIDLVSEYSDAQYQSSIAPPYERIKTFGARWVGFWDKLVQAAAGNGALYDERLFESVLSPWLKAVSSSRVRAWRRMATMAAFAVTSALNALSSRLSQRSDVIEQQLSDKKIGKAAAALTKEQNNISQQLDVIFNIADALFNDVFVHRFRDTDVELRVLCMERLGEWLLALPSHWLDDKRLKYLGWTLNDKHPSVRRASLQSVLNVLQSGDPSLVAKANSFLERFSGRFFELSNDIDASVAAVAIELMSAFLDLGRLDENEGDNVPPMLWDADPDIRARAMHFVYEDTFAEAAVGSTHEEDITQLLNLFDRYLPEDASGAGADKADRRRVQVADGKLRVGRPTLQQPMDLLVNAFWPKLAALQDYAAITKTIIKFASAAADGKVVGKRVVVDDDRQTSYLHLLNSVSACATGVSSDPSLPSASSSKKSERDAVAEQRSAFSGVFIGACNQLLSLYLQDAVKVQLLLPVLRRIDLEQYSLLRKKKDLTALLSLLRDVMLKHSESGVLEEAAAALAHLARSEHAYREESEAAVQELATKLVDDFNTLYEQVHGTQMPTHEDDERLLAMLSTLTRMLSLSRTLLPLPQMALDAVPNVEKSLNFYAMSHERKQEQDILVVLMQLAFAHLQANMQQLFEQLRDEEPEDEAEEEQKHEDEEEEQKSSKRGKKGKGKGKGKSAAASASHGVLLSATRRLQSVFTAQLDLVFSYSAANNAAVQDAAFRILTDAFVLFSGKLGGTALESLSIGHGDVAKLHVLQNHYSAYYKHAMEAPRAKKAASPAAVDRRIEATCMAAKVAGYDLNSAHIKDEQHSVLRHRELAGHLLSRYGQGASESGSSGEAEAFVSSEVDAVLKELQHVLKGVSTNTLLSAQFEALKVGWDASRDVSVLTQQASKFVLLHNIRAETRSFAGLLRHGLVFALREPPQRLDFLHVLVPFVQRASLADLKDTAHAFKQYGTTCLQHVPEEERTEEDEWGAIEHFAAAMNKKFTREIIIVHPNAILLSGEAGSVAPMTPMMPATPARKGGRAYTADISPIASPAPASAAVSGRRARPSAALGKVEESVAEEEEEEEANGNGAPARGRRSKASAAAGKKRGRKARGDEDEEEEEEAAVEEEEEQEEASPMEEEEEEEPQPRRGRKRGAQ